MAKNRPHPNDDQRGGYVKALVVKKGSGGGNGGQSSYVCDWSVFPADLLGKLVWAVNIQGSSVLFGQTRNGHTYTVSLYAGTDKAHWYFEPTEAGVDEFYAFAESIIEAALNSPEGLEYPYQGR